MIAIIDYKMGNLRSVQKAFEHVGADARIVRGPEEARRADKVVLPGVGAFRDAMAQLRERDLIEPIVETIAAGRPFLGICLGLQLLFDVSYEDGEHAGLGVLKGKVVRFDFAGRPDATSLKIPHMGWNELRWNEPCPLLEGIRQGQHFYFVHSYHVVPENDQGASATSDYGLPFTAMVWRERMFATQFHPEKSQAAGLRIIRNFAELPP